MEIIKLVENLTGSHLLGGLALFLAIIILSSIVVGILILIYRVIKQLLIRTKDILIHHPLGFPKIIVRLFYYPITLIIYFRKKKLLKVMEKRSKNKVAEEAQVIIESTYFDNLTAIKQSSLTHSIYNIHKDLLEELKKTNPDVYGQYKYDKCISQLTLDEKGLQKFAKAFQADDTDRHLYVIGKISYANSDTLCLDDSFGSIEVHQIDNANIQYLRNYLMNAKNLDKKNNIVYDKEERRCGTWFIESLLGKDIENFIVAVPILIYAKNKTEEFFKGREVGHNGWYQVAPNMPIALVYDTANKYNDYSLYSLIDD